MKSGGSEAIKIGLWAIGIYIAYVIYRNWKNAAATTSSSTTSTTSVGSTVGSSPVTNVGSGAPTNSVVPTSSSIPPSLANRPVFTLPNRGNAWGVATPIVRVGTFHL